MIKVNLLPPEFRMKEETGEISLRRLATSRNLLRFVLVLVVLEMGFFLESALWAGPRIGAFQEELATLEPQHKVVRMMQGELQKSRVTDTQIRTWFNRPFYWTNLLRDLSDSVIPGVWLSHIEITRREFDISAMKDTGTAPGPRLFSAGRRREKRVVFVLSGRTAVRGQETATIGRVIQRLKKKEVFSRVMEDIYLENIKRVEREVRPLFEFSIVCVVKKELESEFYDAT